ncbi:imidazole glycerol phosphate synthase [Pseudomonas syringae]|uniref:hypothetical protein n=1 Tax=Pseudomonas syringae TaxID=317 RepID=UPI001FD9A85B|nr:hypothetical protein [Pseudomonas syringae]MCI3945047.1 imidazole glycerol phosphate synthase [Pseudomonas syringae]
MAGYSAESLLAWMKDTTRLRGWDAIVALDGDKVNGLVEHVYQQGVANGLSRPVPDGSIVIPDTHAAHFFRAVCSARRLCLSNTVFWGTLHWPGAWQCLRGCTLS